MAPIEVATASAASVSDSAQSSIAKTSLDGFSAGNIISDAVFTNKNTMTEAQIQAFFNSKVSKCVTGNDENGKPYVCLKDFKITSVNRVADAYCNGYQGAANESAARIIYKVAQSCNINPQVLIVMLQKEQGLVTHVWPSAWRYNIALGQGCPDTAPCDPGYIGFFHQIYGAARQMQMYMEGKYFTWYAPGKTWGIQWHPNASCGKGDVYIANKATAALYYYTPYQPNAAAMRAGYGVGDSCSSYGNRNFYNYFTDWFGSTQASLPKPELASVNHSAYVLALDSSSTLWGYPFEDGYWGERVRLATEVNGMKAAYSVGDLDGDGSRDVVAVDKTNKPWLLRGTGDGFGPAEPIAADWGDTVLVTPAGDFNGDGIPDMFTTAADGTLFLWRGNNMGGFRSPIAVGRGWQGMTELSGGLDFDGDGAPDLLARDSAGRLFMYAGTGYGGWSHSRQVGKGWGGLSSLANVGDFNGDSVSDVIARDSAGDLWLYGGRGGGSLESGVKIGTGWGSFVSLQSSGAVARAPRPLSPGIGDFDADGGVDVMALTSGGHVLLYRGDAQGGWRGQQTLATGWNRADVLVSLGDFDRDGSRDYGRIDRQGIFSLQLGSASPGSMTQIGRGWSTLDLVFGGIDFDGDRKTDVVARDKSGNLVLYRGNGVGGWGDSFQIGRGWGSIETAFYAGDFDGDGHGDIIARRGDDNTLWLYPTNGNGGWGSARQIGRGWGALEALFSPGDFDGDGFNDVIARTSAGELILYRGDGRGGWLGSRAIGRGWTSMQQIK